MTQKKEKRTFFGWLKWAGNRYFIRAMSSMALGLFSSLIIGLILSQLGKLPYLGFLAPFAEVVGASSPVVGSAIGAAIAWGLADDLGTGRITAAGQTERLEITGSGERSEKAVDIHAPAGQTVTVFETLRAEKGLLVRTALHVEKDAKVRLVQIQNAAQGSLLRLETSGECAENGQVELIQVLLGRGDVYSDGQFELNGNGAGFTAGIGYLGQKQQTVDMNLVVNHWGQKTTSEINAAGALKDDAQKIFRGTIDFKKGSAGSVGSEQETVLMLGDGVVNKTVPLILCAEENVVGNHGATIGELDEDTLFYFESRGISAAEAENIMARAAIERLARTIEDEAAQAAILSELEEVL